MNGKPMAFEALKIALKQDRGGHVLTLVIHPDETPDQLWRDPVGKRYGVALVALDEEGEAFNDEAEGERVFKMHGARCRDAGFQLFMLGPNDATESKKDREESCRDAVKKSLGIASSTDIRDKPKVRLQFLELLKTHEQDRP